MPIRGMTIFITLLMLSCVEPKKKVSNTISYSSAVSVCDDEKSRNFISTSELTAKRYNETIGVLDGPFEFKKKIDGIIKIEWLIEKVLPTGNKELVLTYEVADFCKEVKDRFKSDNLAGQYYKSINFTAECPLEAGIYYIDNMVADIQQMSVNSFPLGIYTITFIFYDTKTRGSGALATTTLTKLGCLYFDCTIEPKE